MKTLLHYVGLALFCAIFVAAQTNATPSRNYADSLVSSTRVDNPYNAVDSNRDNYAVLRANIGVLNFARITVGFSTPGDGGESVAIEFQNDNGILTADVLGSISVSVFDSHGTKIAGKSGFNFAEAHLIEGTSHYVLDLKTNSNALDISSVKIRISGLLSLENRIRLYNVWIFSTCPLLHGDILYAYHNVNNPENAIDKDKNDFALLTPPLVAGNSYLDIGFSQPGVAGKKVGFLLGEGNTLLSAALLDHITIAVFDTEGNLVVEKSNFTLADAEVLPNGRFNLRVKTPNGNYQVGRGRITITGLVNVLTTLKEYGINAHQICNSQNVQDENVNPVTSINLQVAPNPFNSYTTLSIKSKLSNPAYVIISDKAGNIIEQHQVVNATSVHLLEKAPAGMYFVKITSDSFVETRKIIKM